MAEGDDLLPDTRGAVSLADVLVAVANVSGQVQTISAELRGEVGSLRDRMTKVEGSVDTQWGHIDELRATQAVQRADRRSWAAIGGLVGLVIGAVSAAGAVLAIV